MEGLPRLIQETGDVHMKREIMVEMNDETVEEITNAALIDGAEGLMEAIRSTMFRMVKTESTSNWIDLMMEVNDLKAYMNILDYTTGEVWNFDDHISSIDKTSKKPKKRTKK